MLSFDSEDIPPKVDSATIPTTASTTTTTSTSGECCPPPVTTTTTTDAATTTTPETIVGDTTIPVTSNFSATMQRHLQQKSKYLRDVWTNVANTTTLSTTRAANLMTLPKISTDYSQLVVIAILTIVAIGCSCGALFTKYWSCDPSRHYGIWNTCFTASPNGGILLGFNDGGVIVKKNVHSHALPTLLTTSTPKNESFFGVLFNPANNATTTTMSSLFEQVVGHNTPLSAHIATSILCAQQMLTEVKVDFAEQWRVDQVTAAQGLIVSGTVLYIFSLIAILFAWKWVSIPATTITPGTVKKLNSVRNLLAFSVGFQIVSFFLQLIGFFLFIYTDRFSTSIGILFFYFGLAIFATNVINFITIEYKMFKTRQNS